MMEPNQVNGTENTSEQPESTKKRIEYDESLFENSTVFGKSSNVTKKQKKLKPIIKGIIISGGALIVAAAVLIVTIVIPSGKKDNVSSMAPTPSYSVVDIDEKDIKTVTVYNKCHPGGYKLIKVYSTAENEESSSSGEQEYKWRVEGYEKYDMTGTEYLVSAATGIKSGKKYDAVNSPKADDYEIEDVSFEAVEESSDTSKTADVYGFSTPYALISIEKSDGQFKILVGDTSPDSSGRYVTVSGDDNIYVVSESNMTYFDADYKDMIAMTTVDFFTPSENNTDYYSDGNFVKIDNIKLGGTCRSKPVTVESPPDSLSVISYVVTSPVFRAGDEDSINNILSSVATMGLMNDGSFVLGYTPDDLKKYGLDNPFSTCEMNIGDYHVNLKFGAPTDGYYPCICDGSDIIYKITVSEEDDWISYKDTDLYYDSLFLEYITDVSEINVKTDKKDVTFKLNHSTDEKGAKTFTVTCDQAKKGVEIAKKQMSYYYGRILNLATEEFTDSKVPDTDPYMTLTFKYNKSSKKSDTIRLYRYSTRRYYYTLNGMGNSLVSATSVKDLYARLDDLLNGVEIERGK